MKNNLSDNTIVLHLLNSYSARTNLRFSYEHLTKIKLLPWVGGGSKPRLFRSSAHSKMWVIHIWCKEKKVCTLWQLNSTDIQYNYVNLINKKDITMHYKLQKWFIQLFLHISVLKWIDVHCYTWYSHEVESYLTKKNKVCMHTMIPAHTCSAVTSLLF